MSQWRGQHRSGSGFDDLEGGEIAEQENERELGILQDRVNFLKRLTTDIHEEAQSHSRILDHMATGMDTARATLSGSLTRFKKVFETKSGRNMFTVIVSFLLVFLLIYYIVK